MSLKNEAAIVNELGTAIVSDAKKLKAPMNIMEICGTHTMDICRYGLRSMLPGNISLISGPGCPVCVTPIEEVDRAIEISRQKDVITATFGDMMRVPGTRSTLNSEKSKGADIRVLYSPEDGLELARKNPDKRVVFIGVGFETTSPAIALTVMSAKKEGLKNFLVLPAFKTVIPPMEALLSDKELKINGFIAPGHVSAVIGAKPYEYITGKYKVPCVITGFEAGDIMQGIHMLIKQRLNSEGRVEIQYKRIVRYEGNKVAADAMKEVFAAVDSNWRGIGVIPKSGLTFGPGYEGFNALNAFNPDVSYSKEPKGCRCGEVLKGMIKPPKCPLFAKKCTPFSWRQV